MSKSVKEEINHWNPLIEPTDNSVGFVYKITNISNNKFYIGKKQFYSTRTVKLSKKKSNELYSGVGRKPVKGKNVIETDWRTYTGSNKVLNEDIKVLGKSSFKFEILRICVKLSELKYQELKHQILYNCLEDINCYNEWIKITISKNQL